MGAHFNHHTFSALNRTDAIKKAEAYQRHCQDESGHGPYTGHLGTVGVGVTALTSTFASEDDALRHIEEVHSKWDPPILARIQGTDTWILAGLCPS